VGEEEVEGREAGTDPGFRIRGDADLDIFFGIKKGTKMKKNMSFHQQPPTHPLRIFRRGAVKSGLLGFLRGGGTKKW